MALSLMVFCLEFLITCQTINRSWDAQPDGCAWPNVLLSCYDKILDTNLTITISVFGYMFWKHLLCICHKDMTEVKINVKGIYSSYLRFYLKLHRNISSQMNRFTKICLIFCVPWKIANVDECKFCFGYTLKIKHCIKADKSLSRLCLSYTATPNYMLPGLFCLRSKS